MKPTSPILTVRVHVSELALWALTLETNAERSNESAKENFISAGKHKQNRWHWF
jgi:hypothetical protein